MMSPTPPSASPSYSATRRSVGAPFFSHIPSQVADLTMRFLMGIRPITTSSNNDPMPQPPSKYGFRLLSSETVFGRGLRHGVVVRRGGDRAYSHEKPHCQVRNLG